MLQSHAVIAHINLDNWQNLETLSIVEIVQEMYLDNQHSVTMTYDT
jgi:hypothetical protein